MLAGARDGDTARLRLQLCELFNVQSVCSFHYLATTGIADDVRDGTLRFAFVEEECRDASHRVGRAGTWQFWLALQLMKPLTNMSSGEFCVALHRRWKLQPQF